MINGPLHGGAVAADVSAAVAALNKSTRRSVNHPPTKIHHLNNAVVIRQISIAERTAMKVAKVTQPPPGINMGAAITSTITITVVTVLRASVNGGGASQQLLDRPKITIINPYGSRVLELAMPAIQRVVGIADATINVSASPVVINENITVMSNKKQLGAYYEKNAHACRKARVLTSIENEQSLGAQLMTYVESF
jgi:hypothetical protein